MRLVNVKTKQPIVEFKKEEVLFYNKYLEKQMQYLGIPIPHGMRGFYNGSDIIFLGDHHFPQAFREIYYTNTMNAAEFHWIE